MLVLTGQDLCTANFMVVPMALMKGRIKMWELPVNWLIVFFGNLAGALTYVAFLGMSHLSTPNHLWPYLRPPETLLSSSP